MKKELLLNFIITLVIGILTFAINRYFVIYIGIAALGIMKLFNQLLYYLNLVEMGIGGASTYAFYEPLMKNDYKKISIIFVTHFYFLPLQICTQPTKTCANGLRKFIRQAKRKPSLEWF